MGSVAAAISLAAGFVCDPFVVQHLELGEQHTLSTANVPLEILPFVREINRLLAVLADRLKRSRQASGNMAHTIKTSLTLLLQLTEAQELDSD